MADAPAAAIDLPDDELRLAVIARAPGAWAALQARFGRLMVACVRKVLRRYGALHTEEDVEDILGQVCLNLVKDDYRKLRQYDPRRGYQLASFVGLITMNTARDALRRRPPRSQPLPGEEEGSGPELAGPDPGPAAALERREAITAFASAVAALDEEDRVFLILYYEEEHPAEEIARRMGIALPTVYSRKFKVREKLRALVDRKDAAAPA